MIPKRLSFYSHKLPCEVGPAEALVIGQRLFSDACKQVEGGVGSKFLLLQIKICAVLLDEKK